MVCMNSELRKKIKLLVFVVSYKAESTIESVLDRIPESIWNNQHFETEALIIDDQSSDLTFHKAHQYSTRYPHKRITVLHNPQNLGYGGNQKLGYHYAIRYGFEIVVLLHGDGQYAPEYIPQMIKPIEDGFADAVFGSRMQRPMKALKGKMPFYKWVGNQVLTYFQNKILNTHLSEFHSGYRAYRVGTLKNLPFEYNSNYFDFDTDIIIQLIDTHQRIHEISIPTFYGDEISRVNGIRYAFKIIQSCFLSRLNKLALYYHPKFDYDSGSNFIYHQKFGFPSSQQYALDAIKPNSTVLDIGCGPGYMAEKLARKHAKTISLDRQIQPQTIEHSWRTIATEIETFDFDELHDIKVDVILLLDIVEHLKNPEKLLQRLRSRFSQDCPEVIMTTGNVGFFTIRLGLLLNRFNYGKQGILDMDHTRLFTASSLKRIFENNGYQIKEMKGIPAPFPLAIGSGVIANFLLSFNQFLIFLSKGLFAFQLAVKCKPLPTLEHLLANAYDSKEEKFRTEQRQWCAPEDDEIQN